MPQRPGGGEDFDPPAPARVNGVASRAVGTAAGGLHAQASAAAAAPAAEHHQQPQGACRCSNDDSPLAAPAVPLDGLPSHVLERVLARLDLSSVLAAACTCQALHRTAQADGLWRQLFQQRWGGVVFPTCREAHQHTSSCGRPAGSSGSCGVSEAAAAGGSSPARQPVPAFAAGESAQHAGGSSGPDRPPAAGSWQAQFKRQYAYQRERRCVKCGAAGAIVPILYGFPSVQLLAGMEAQPRRLVLGGDHLIDSCHVWTCSSCRCAFRFWPYARVHLWLGDDAAQQRRNAAQAAAGRGHRGGEAAAAAATGGGGPGGQPQQQPEQQGGSDHDDHLPAGMQRYTYEL